MKKQNLKYVHFNGCAFGLEGPHQMFLRKPWCIATNDVRLLQDFGQHTCPENYGHEPTQGINAIESAFFTAEFTEMLFQFIPGIQTELSGFFHRCQP